MSIALALHVLFAVVWVGGMAFAMLVLRPAMTEIQPPQRLALMAAVLRKFFVWVWKAVVILPATGFWLIFTGYGGFAQAGLHVHLMTALGLLMIAIFLFLYFRYFLPFRRLLEQQDTAAAGTLAARIRALIWTNLALGTSVILIAAGGRYW